LSNSAANKSAFLSAKDNETYINKNQLKKPSTSAAFLACDHAALCRDPGIEGTGRAVK
jgi:hypothetical protein